MKYIDIPTTNFEAIEKEFSEYLRTLKTNAGRITFTKDFDAIKKVDTTKIVKPNIYFSATALIKMIILVQSCPEEIAWQAPVKRIAYQPTAENPNPGFYYVIGDPLVYPQEVSGTSVVIQETEYAQWSMKLSDEVYNSLRFQGHSHVNMGVHPSAVDDNTYNSFLSQLKKDDYYIFLIMNKRFEMEFLVYDYSQNIIFETADVTWDIFDTTGKSITAWKNESMKALKRREIVPTPYKNLYEDSENIRYRHAKDGKFFSYDNTTKEYIIFYGEYGYKYYKNPKEKFDTDFVQLNTNEKKTDFYKRNPTLITNALPSESSIRRELKAWLEERAKLAKNARKSTITCNIKMDGKQYNILPMGAKK